MRGFTFESSGLLREIIIPMRISLPMTLDKIGKNPGIEANSLWDTGATSSCITKRLANKLNLKPSTFGSAKHAGGVTQNVPIYIVNLYLPNKVALPFLQVQQIENQDKFDILIGMNVITGGDFAVTNKNGKTMFSYAYPSTHHIDFGKMAAQSERILKQPTTTIKEPGAIKEKRDNVLKKMGYTPKSKRKKPR